MSLSTIFQLYRGGQFSLVEETGIPTENHRPVASHWQTLSHNIVSNTPHHERGSNSQLPYDHDHNGPLLKLKVMYGP